MSEKTKKNKRIDEDEEIFKILYKEYKARKKQTKAEHKSANPDKLTRTIKFVKENTAGIFSGKKEKKNKKVKQTSKGILAKHADELAEAMKKARSKKELFQLAQLMRKQSKEIQEIARRI